MDIFVPNAKIEKFSSADEALAATTHLAVSAHEDDIEFMAYDGILKCYNSVNGQGKTGIQGRFSTQKPEVNSFTAVVMTDGAGSPRDGKYANCTDEEMKAIRKEEQKKAAEIGKYGALVFADLPSSQVKDISDRTAVETLKDIIAKTRPSVIYSHNPADKHDTHVATVMNLIKALRELEYLPDEFYGCEVWRSLDWVCDSEKLSFDVGGNSDLERGILEVFDSQIAGGKRYDLAVMGRRRANATFSESHGVDKADEVIYAVDLLPLLKDKSLSVAEYMQGFIERFKADVTGRIGKFEVSQARK